jgi:hypothetical protein
MVRRLVLSLACVLVVGHNTHVAETAPLQAPARTATAAPDGVIVLLARLEQMLQASDPSQFTTLLSPLASVDQAQEFASEIFMPETKRAVVRERDRAPLQGALPGDGFRLVVELFTESAARGRIVTARIDVRRPRTSEELAAWRISAVERLTSVEGLHRLTLNSAKQFTARNLVITSEDLKLTLTSGTAFVVDSAEGPTGLVLFGVGEMQFSPTPETERGQVRIFCGNETLVARFETAFIRLSPAEWESRIASDSLTAAPVDARLLRRAQDVFSVDGPKSFSLDLSDLSRDTWYLLPSMGDFLAEVRTKKFGALTYARSTGEAEDITLFDREKHRNIALYPSVQKLASRGKFYNEDDLSDYDILDYNIEASVYPDREFIEGRARMRIRVRAYTLATLTIRLADPLAVTMVASAEHGRLLYLRVRNQNSIVINLPVSLPRDSEIMLVIGYAGRLTSQGVDREALTMQPPRRGEDVPFVPAEPNYLLSNRSFWYPQGQVTDYATATMRISVPEGYSCVASGELTEGSPVLLRDSAAQQGGKRLYVFNASDPLRYLALVVSRFMRVSTVSVAVGAETKDTTEDGTPARVSPDGTRQPGFRIRDKISLSVEANPRQQSRGREISAWAGDILRFFAGLMGDTPYTALTVALIENDLPGGHSPGYVALLNNPLPTTPFVWRNDPASFSGFPEFFLAHELAHQWWGQAVGWKTYHEQWISEGFAQYFAALYAQKKYGDTQFVDMLRQFRRWAMSQSDQGPVSLGYRLGHIKGDSRVFRALLYNKGAAVLHMLRRLVGDEKFFSALRRFYTDEKFKKAGTDDLQRAFEAETGRQLDRFFDRWIYGASLPRLRCQTKVNETGVTVRFEQMTDLIFDVPVTVTIVYADGRMADVVVAVTDHQLEQKIPVDGQVRSVQINRDSAALANFDVS